MLETVVDLGRADLQISHLMKIVYRRISVVSTNSLSSSESLDLNPFDIDGGTLHRSRFQIAGLLSCHAEAN